MKKIISALLAAVMIAATVLCATSCFGGGGGDTLFSKFDSRGLKFALSDDGKYYILVDCSECTDDYIVIPNEYCGLPVKEIAAGLGIADTTKGIKIPANVERIGWDYFSNDAGKFIFTNDPIWPKKSNNERLLYEYQIYRNCGFIELKNFGEWLKEKYTAKSGEENFETAEYKAAVSAVRTGDVRENADAAAFKSEFEKDGFTVEYREPVYGSDNKLKAGGSAYLIAYKPVFKNRNVFFPNRSEFGALGTVAVDGGNKTFVSKNNCVIEKKTGRLIAGVGHFEIPDDGTVRSIGTTAFWFNCSTTAVTLPRSLVSIEPEASSVNHYTKNTIFVVFNKSKVDISYEWAESDFPGSVGYMKSSGYESVAPFGLTIVGDGHEIIPTHATADKYPDMYKLVDGERYLIFRSDENSDYKIMAHVGDDEEATLPRDGSGQYYLPYNMRGVVNMRWPAPLSEIPTGAFSNCCSLEKIYLHDDLTDVGAFAFSGCTRLESIALPQSVKSIGMYAFQGCLSLRSADVPEGVTEIGNGTFEGCKKLEQVKLPSTVNKLGRSAFYGCRSLKSVAIPDGVTELPDFLFMNCDGLESVKIPASVTKIGQYVFPIGVNVEIRYAGSESDWNKIDADETSKSADITVKYNG